MMAERMELWRLSNFDARAAALRAGRLPVPRRRAREPPRRAAGRHRRDPRRHTGPGRGGPDHRAAGARAHRQPGVRGDALGPVAPAGPPAAAVEPRAALHLAGDRLRPERGGRDHRALRPRDGRARARAGDVPRAHARVDGGERERALRIFNPAGRGVVVEVGDPPTQPLQPLDEGAQRIVSARRRGTLHPAEIVKILAPSGRAGAAIPPASSSSTTSTTTASSSRSTARRRPTARASWSA